MPVTDPIADLLTRIRNAGKAKKKRVDIPSSKMKVAIAEILKDQGYIADYSVVDDGKQGVLTIMMRYYEGRTPFNEIMRVSRPGIRTYKSIDEMQPVRSGLGIAILSTSKGVMTDKQARKENVGGEVLCTVW
jgi:small subunit ribosomal protein S8